MNVKRNGPYRPTPALEKMLKDRSVSIIVNDFLGVDWQVKELKEMLKEDEA